ncbi:MAG: hypothetical protein AAGI28_15405 [Pseudomonadota bacterium]
MNGSVAQALSGHSNLSDDYVAFRDAATAALGEHLTAHIRHAIAETHGLASEVPAGDAPAVCLDYARRMPFEHTAITDEEAKAVVSAIGEQRYVALSVVAALADAECRAERVDLVGLVDTAK